MRRVVFALVIFLVCASAATGVRVHASTECERWIAEYRNVLAHSPMVKRVNAARHRLHHYIHRKIATLTKPKPKKPRVLPVRHRGPRMTREEMLRKFELACGELPVDSPEEAKLVEDPAPAFAMSRHTNDLDTGDDGPGMLLAMNEAPIYFGGGSSPGGGGTGFYLPPFGGLPPGGGGQRTPTTTGTGGDNPPPPPSTPSVPTAETPEPGSLLLVATGFAGAAAALRRGMRRAA